MTTGQRIKAARKKAGLTQEDLGKKLGVSGSFIAQYETNNRNPKLETLQRIAVALETAVSELVEPGYWSTVTKEEVAASWVSTPDRVVAALRQMTAEGQNKVADYAEDILPRYKAGEATSEAAGGTPLPSKGQSTTPAPDGPTAAPEGE